MNHKKTVILLTISNRTIYLNYEVLFMQDDDTSKFAVVLLKLCN